jgi:hypothetical protein
MGIYASLHKSIHSACHRWCSLTDFNVQRVGIVLEGERERERKKERKKERTRCTDNELSIPIKISC